jgi:hypothetical protein
MSFTLEELKNEHWDQSFAGIFQARLWDGDSDSKRTSALADAANSTLFTPSKDDSRPETSYSFTESMPQLSGRTWGLTLPSAPDVGFEFSNSAAKLASRVVPGKRLALKFATNISPLKAVDVHHSQLSHQFPIQVAAR